MIVAFDFLSMTILNGRKGCAERYLYVVKTPIGLFKAYRRGLFAALLSLEGGFTLETKH